MQLFRAIPTSDVRPGRAHTRRDTVRWPINVPFVIDNIWEHLRPDDMPSRRHAVYASPTPALALANASGTLREGDRYVACQVVIPNGAPALRMAKLPVDDARRHPDRRVLTALLEQALKSPDGVDALAHQRLLAPLFLPVLSKVDMAQLAGEEPLVADVLGRATIASTFWTTAMAAAVADSPGELFFDLREGETYTLRPVG